MSSSSGDTAMGGEEYKAESGGGGWKIIVGCERGGRGGKSCLQGLWK